MPQRAQSRLPPPAASGPRSRAPVQERSQQRVAAALAIAERMIETRGPDETSIPDIALAAGIPRASLYQFFPTKYALFAHITRAHLQRVADGVLDVCARHKDKPWRELFPRLVGAAADYYDTHRVAGILVLCGPTSREDFVAQHAIVGHIAAEIRRIVTRLPERVRLPRSPDVATIAVEIAFACLKHGYVRDHRLSKPIRAEAARAAICYIAEFESPPKPGARR